MHNPHSCSPPSPTAFIYGCSPRKGGNSDLAVQLVQDVLRSQEITADSLFVRDYTLAPCRGCQLCLGRGEQSRACTSKISGSADRSEADLYLPSSGVCVLDGSDDAGRLFAPLFRAGCIFFVSPVYFYHLPAQFKAFIDRGQACWAMRERGCSALEALPQRQAHVILIAAREKGEKLFQGSLLSLQFFLKPFNISLSEPLFLRGLDSSDALSASGQARKQVISYAQSAGQACLGDRSNQTTPGIESAARKNAAPYRCGAGAGENTDAAGRRVQIWNTARSGMLKIFSVFLDRRCQGCGEIISAADTLAFIHQLCPACYAALAPLPAGQPAPGLGPGPASWRKQTPAWSDFLSLGPYDGLLRRLLLELKFHSGLYVAELLGSLLASRLRSENFGVFDLIVPVPLHELRLRERGYNQSLEIGRRISHALKIPLSTHSLIKTRHAPPQESLSLGERKKAVKGAFAVTTSFSGKRVLLLDDVITTGSTLKECAQILSEAGAARVSVAVAAWTAPAYAAD